MKGVIAFIDHIYPSRADKSYGAHFIFNYFFTKELILKNVSLLKKNTYFDSVTLMGISKKLLDLPTIIHASVSMGTQMNKQLLLDSGFDAPSLIEANANDLMIACQVDDDIDENTILLEINTVLSYRENLSGNIEEKPKGIKSALNQIDANVCVISLPGAYAVREAKKALKSNLHVMLFSDNISLADEKALKEFAHQKGLLLMGPDCGTSIINHKALCFANVVEQGNVGIVSASGTGAQEISVLLSHEGIGISQLIGIGGRDLSHEIGGIMMKDALSALAEDEKTDIIILISKPPAKEVADSIYNEIRQIQKSVIVCFLGIQPDQMAFDIRFSDSLEDAVSQTIAIAGKSSKRHNLLPNLSQFIDKKEKNKYSNPCLRALFCGGTLAEEARLIFNKINPDLHCYSNTAKNVAAQLAHIQISQANTFLDMGDDAFTLGKPHPMIAPDVRNDRLLQEAEDPNTAVILMDFVLGYGAHPDPVGVVLPIIESIQTKNRHSNRKIIFVAYLLGTDRDPQNYQSQYQKLIHAGVIVGQSNAHAARIAAEFIKEMN